MANIVLDTITSGYNLSKINANFGTIQTILNADRLQLTDGGNIMSQDLDMNSNDILNGNLVYAKGIILNGTPLTFSTINGLSANSVGTDQIVDGSVTASKLATNLGLDSASFNFLSDATGAVSRTVKSKLSEAVSVKDFGAVGDGVADDTLSIQAAVNYAETIGGCIVYIPKGVYKITDTINIGLINYNSAIFVGDGAGNESGGGASQAPTIIQWFGATAGGTVMMKQSGQTFWGMNDMCLDGRYHPGSAGDTTNKPDYGLMIDRTQYSRFENVRITGWLRCGIYFQPITAANNDNCSYNQFINLTVSGYNPSGVAIEMHGNSATFGGTVLHTSNTCHNTFVQLVIVHAKYGLDIFDADNNSFLMTRIFPRPEATVPIPYGVVLEGSYSRALYFFHLQSGGDMLCNNGSTAIIYGYDRENGSNPPTTNAGSKIYWECHGNNGSGIFNADLQHNLVAAVSGDAALANSANNEASLFTVLNGSNGSRLCVGTINSPRAVNMYSHTSSTPTKPVLQFGDDTMVSYLLGSRKHTTGTAAPTTGAWSIGDTIHNTAPTPGGVMGWICTASGAPGTWKTWGIIGT